MSRLVVAIVALVALAGCPSPGPVVPAIVDSGDGGCDQAVLDRANAEALVHGDGGTVVQLRCP